MIRIRELREAKGIQQKELAIDLCVSQPTISDWESGRKIPSAKSTLKIADYFGVSIDYLLGRDELHTFFCDDDWHDDQTQDYNKLNSDDEKQRFLAVNGYDKDHIRDAERLFPAQFLKKEPTPVSEDGLSAEQADLVRLYDAAPPALRAAALAVLKSAEEQNTPPGGAATDE